jgi:hypothetical protein
MAFLFDYASVWVDAGFGCVVSSTMLPIDSGFCGPGWITMMASRVSDDHGILVMAMLIPSTWLGRGNEKMIGSITIAGSNLEIPLTPRVMSSVPFPSDGLIRRKACPTELRPASDAYTKSCT